MRAVFAETFGGDDPLANLRISEQPEPRLEPGMAWVRVTAASLNHHDIWTLKGVSARALTGPQILGCDAAGVVEAYAGEAPAGAPALGSRVVVHAVVTCGACSACLGGEQLICPRLGLLSEPPNGGALADTVVVPAANLIALPDSVADTDAACLPTAYLTAYRMLFVRGQLKPGQTVLIQGASGGVATAAILLARAAGVTVFATARTDAKRSVGLDAGANAVFDSTDPAAFKAVLAASSGGVDAVIDTVGEPTWDLSLRCLRAGGIVVVSGATGGANPPAQLNRVFWKHLTVAGSSMGSRAELQRVVSLCASGALTPLVDSVRPIEEAGSAFARLAAGEQRGKLVISLSA